MSNQVKNERPNYGNDFLLTLGWTIVVLTIAVPTLIYMYV
jgi:hypothetical protein